MYICTHARSCFIFKYRVFGKKCSNYSFDAISFSLAEVVRNDNLKQETTENFQPWRETKNWGSNRMLKRPERPGPCSGKWYSCTEDCNFQMKPSVIMLKKVSNLFISLYFAGVSALTSYQKF